LQKHGDAYESRIANSDPGLQWSNHRFHHSTGLQRRIAMSFKRYSQFLVVLAILAGSLGMTGSASAYTCSAYITVQWGDTLGGIASLCGTSITAIQSANPGLGSSIYAGQVLYIPTGSTGTYYPPASSGSYVVQWGDTLAIIAGRYGVTVNELLAANPTIYNASYIYAGQYITIPSAPVYHMVQSGQTMQNIATLYGTTIYCLQLLNPQIYNVNWIYAGQVIRVY
jgi:LysM repeat protein